MYHKCAVPGCGSKKGQKPKLMFRGFPKKNVELAQKWINILPFTPFASSYICEHHFDQDQFEKVREDNKRRFKDCAVPTLKLNLSNTIRRPFGDLTNKQDGIKIHDIKTEKSERAPLKWEFVTDPYNVQELGPVPECDPLAIDDSERGNSSCEPVTDAVVDQDDQPSPLHFQVEEVLMESDPPLCHGPPTVAHISDEPKQERALNDDSPDQPGHTNFQVVGRFGYLCDRTGQFFPESNTTEPSNCDEGTLPCPPAKKAKVVLPSDIFQFLSTNKNMEFNEVSADSSLKAVKVTSSDITVYLQNLQGEVRVLKEEARVKDMKNKALQRENHILQQEQAREKLVSPWLHPTQEKLLYRKDSRGITWDSELIREGLIQKMKCGTSGYAAFVKKIPLFPKVRTLQQSVQFVRFESGLLYEVFDLLEIAGKDMPEAGRDCNLVLDEMAIEKGQYYCHSTKQFMGLATFPSHQGMAGKALIFVLAGLQRRWKLTVAACLTSSKKEKQLEGEDIWEADCNTEELISTGKAYKNILDQIITKAESIGFKVAAITSDMGPENLSFWAAYGVVGNRNRPVHSSFRNPGRNSEVFVLPDAIHLIKGIKSTLESNTIIKLPANIVESEGLPSDEVNYKHIKDLYEFEQNSELKIAFRLTPANINVNKQFDKMKMGVHRAVFL